MLPWKGIKVTIRTVSRYELLDELGSGNMGVVYRARDPIMDRTVAVKVIRLGFSLDEEKRALFLERFQREARIAGKLGHPHIIAVHDFGTGDEPYIVMEYFPGESLSSLAERGPLPADEVELIARQLADALAYAHERGVVHRDVKPANVLYKGGCIKLLDFGIAKLESSELTATGEFMGTPSFMAPEIFSDGVADARSDLFSLGVVIYQLLTGRKAFEGGSVSRTIYRVLHDEPAPPSSLRPGIPPGWDRVLKKLLAKARDARYQTARELVEDLDRLSQGDAPSSRKTGAFVAAAAAILVLVLVLGRVGREPIRSEEPPRPATPAPAAAPAPAPAPVLPLHFVARHEHRVGHCTGDLWLAESGVLFETSRHGSWRFRPDRIEELVHRSGTELELRAESETYRFTFLRPALDERVFLDYRKAILERAD
jgi:serine/threonine-protein kinase